MNILLGILEMILKVYVGASVIFSSFFLVLIIFAAATPERKLMKWESNYQQDNED